VFLFLRYRWQDRERTEQTNKKGACSRLTREQRALSLCLPLSAYRVGYPLSALGSAAPKYGGQTVAYFNFGNFGGFLCNSNMRLIASFIRCS
jgi:hypothetical protein